MKPGKYYHSALLTALLLLTSLCNAQPSKIDAMLKAQLDSIGHTDQHYRSLAYKLTSAAADSLGKVYGVLPDSVYSHLMALQSVADGSNLAAVAGIIKERGYPGMSLVGMPTAEVAFYVIQHSSRIKEYFPILQKAGRAKELSPTLVAMMEDRLLTEDEKDQIYGTQLWGNAAKDSVTGIVRPQFYFNPIRDAKNVNRRRQQAGFDKTIEEYAAEMGVAYQIRRPWWWKK